MTLDPIFQNSSTPAPKKKTQNPSWVDSGSVATSARYRINLYVEFRIHLKVTFLWWPFTFLLLWKLSRWKQDSWRISYRCSVERSKKSHQRTTPVAFTRCELKLLQNSSQNLTFLRICTECYGKYLFVLNCLASRQLVLFHFRSVLNLLQNLRKGGYHICASSFAKRTFRSVACAENFHGGLHSVAYGDHLFLVWCLCDVTIWRHIHVSKPTFWQNLLT